MPRIAASVGIFALIAFAIGFNVARYPRVWEMVGHSPSLAQANQPSQPEPGSESATAQSPEISEGSASGQSRAEPDSDDPYSEYGNDPYSNHEYSEGDSGNGWGEDSAKDSSYDSQTYENGYQDQYGNNDGQNGSDPYSDNEYGGDEYGGDEYGEDEYGEDGYGAGDYDSYGHESDTHQPDDHDAYDNSYDYRSQGNGAKEPAEATSAAPYAYNAGETGVPVRSSSGRPMVPLVRPGEPMDAGGVAVSDSAVRHLPPIDRSGGKKAQKWFKQDPPPLYPTTGIH